jgi:class 3 adenylate cyclase
VRVPNGGTFTIVFSDIEDSTSRSAELGDGAWMEVLNVHNAIIRRQVARFRGTEVKAEGDGFMLVFASARAAVGLKGLPGNWTVHPVRWRRGLRQG